MNKKSQKNSIHDFLGTSHVITSGKTGEIQQQMVVTCEHIIESGEGGRSRNNMWV